LLVSIVDWVPVQAPVPEKLDEQVVREGQRLESFGRAMQARAERDKLPRSARQAEQLERLGARMESGVLARSEALGQLRQMAESLDRERMQALAEAKHAGARTAGGANASSIAPGLNPGEMLERMQRGALGSDDTRALARRLDGLERSGIPRRELENALERHRAGADEALREILEKLAQIEHALKEDQELSNAREQVRRARDSLGDPRATHHGGYAASPDMDDDEGEARGVKDSNTGAEAHQDVATSGQSSSAASQGNSSVAADRALSPLRPDSGPSGPVLAPQGQVREGETFASQGRMLPRSNRPSVEGVEMRAEFASQLEAVLSREHYPAHYKEFIRRYFLALSQGAQEPSPGTRGEP
jgi:hypothetical protein